ncbi:MAG: class I tRNA ligase family protein, partial [Minisyncoccia bacterium]
PFQGLKVLEARQKIVEELKQLGLLEKIDENYTHQVATCYKCGTTLEPLPKMQWWIKMKPLAQKAESIIKKNKINFYPKHSKKVALHWLKNIRDWNISRQINWGIRLPVWYCKNNCKPIISSTPPNKCPACGTKEIYQDPDVFDTWFSSGQWPFATLLNTGPKKGEDFKKFYPTDVMETGYDILFFWVLRMIMLGIYRTKKIPFKNVYLHGMVRDKDRQKMSKSKGNVIDPLGVAQIYGVDAVRMALIIGNTPGNDIIISEEKIKAYRNFATKVWNIARFILMHKNQIKISNKIKFSSKNKSKINQALKIKKQVEKHLINFEFHLAGHKVYHYIWHTFADKIIEESKKYLYAGNEKEKQETYLMLEIIFRECLKMLHPFMPFITEEIYQKFNPNKLLLIEKW